MNTCIINGKMRWGHASAAPVRSAVPSLADVCRIWLLHSDTAREVSRSSIICRILVALERDTGLDEKSSIISAMAKLRNPKCIPVLKRLLDVKYQTDYSNVRICDCAAKALRTFYPEGPVWDGNDGSKASRKDLDDYVKKWKSYLAEKK